MNIAYFDCFSGISGDKVLGALIDAGLKESVLKKELAKLPLKDFKLKVGIKKVKGIAATKVDVICNEKSVVRTWPSIEAIINQSKLDEGIKKKSKEMFLKVAEAESKIHRQPLSQVHFHEVGAAYSIVDIVGTVIGIRYLGIEKIYSSHVATGIGLVKTRHGTLPVPAPAVLEILQDVPIYSQGILTEITTPTGAAIIKTCASEFGIPPDMKIKSSGYGAGIKKFDIPNVLRIIVGQSISHDIVDEVTVLETNIDNTSPEFLSYIQQKLFETGALDVWTTPIFMKKNRPAVALSVIAPLELEQDLTDILFQETDTLGLRTSRQLRRKLDRKLIDVETSYGKAQVKLGIQNGQIVTIIPEYEDCAKLARASNVPLKEIHKQVKIAAQKEIGINFKD